MLHPPYMIRLCQKLFASDIYNTPEDDTILIGVCSNWFNQAFDHCSRILAVKPGCTKLWTRIVNLKKLIFQENETSLLSDKMPMQVHPDLLSLASCQELTEKVIKDYVHYIPRYMLLMHENRLIWQIIWTIVEVIAIVVCFLIARKWLFKKNRPFHRRTSRTRLLQLENEIRKDIKRILYETKYLSLVPVLNPELLQIGCPVIGLRISRKQLIHIEKIWNGSAMKTSDNPADANVKLMQKKLQSIFQGTGRHLLIISIEFDKMDDDDDFEPRKSPRTSYIPIHKTENKMGLKRRN